MAEVAGQPNLPGIPSSPVNKRKRNTESASPDARRSKRGAAAPTPANTDISGAGYAESAISAVQVVQRAALAQAAANGSHPTGEHVNVDDFSALQQASAEHSEAADPANASSTAAAALGSMYPTIHVPQPTADTFTHPPTEGTHDDDSSFNTPNISQDNTVSGQGLAMPAPPAPMQVPNGLPDTRYSQPKPAVGSEEWHKQRKDNHKEVERRRRETINEGINELAKIVPGCEKNKGSILQRAVAFIQELKDNEAQNIEKYTLEKLLTQQAIAELSQSNDKLKSEVERLYREVDTWKKAAQNAGLQGSHKEEPAAGGSSN